ncbi:MAG TPA: hypothetical protein VFK48_01665 [Usitatibacter sp.]|nr:hypothetical protein [Usitatibacter sp.]
MLRFLLAALLMGLSLGASAQRVEFDRLEQQLRLKPHQKVQFDLATAATQRALLASAMELMQLKQRLADELQKPRPDLGTLLLQQENAFELSKPLFREAGEEWKKLYALMDDDQVAIAKRYVEEQLRGLPGLLR